MSIRVTNVTAQVLYVDSNIQRSMVDHISFGQEPFARTIRVSNFVVQILQSQSPSANTSQSLEFSEFLLEGLVPRERFTPESVLSFSEEVFVSGNPYVVDNISFEQTVRSSIWSLDLQQTLGIRDGVSFCSGAPWEPVVLEDILELSGRISFLVPQETSNTIVFSDAVSLLIDQYEHIIEFIQEVSVGKGADATSTITFTQAIETENDFLRVVEHANFVQHAMTYYIDGGCNKKNYKPFTGEGTAAGIPDQRLVFDANMALEATTAEDLLVLRNPETDDIDRLGFNRINRETRGGELNVYGDPNWSKVNTLLFTIVALSDGKNGCPNAIDAALTFFQTYLGEEIILHDHTGTSWRGVVTTPNERATEDRDGFWTLTFEFEGVEEPGSVPQNAMVLSDTMGLTADWSRSASDSLLFNQTVHAGGDIYLNVSDSVSISDDLSGSQQTTLVQDSLSSGAAVSLNGTTPNTGSSQWVAHNNYLDDGTMVSGIRAGAYYPYTPQGGTVYQLTFESATVTSYLDGFNGLWGFFEGVPSSTVSAGQNYDGTLGETTSKAVHTMGDIPTSDRHRTYRLGTNTDGNGTSTEYTDSSLRDNPDDALDLRILLDTSGETWTAQWLAKDTGDSNYTEVGPVTNLLSQQIGSIGFSCDNHAMQISTGVMNLTELRPI